MTMHPSFSGLPFGSFGLLWLWIPHFLRVRVFWPLGTRRVETGLGDWPDLFLHFSSTRAEEDQHFIP